MPAISIYSNLFAEICISANKLVELTKETYICSATNYTTTPNQTRKDRRGSTCKFPQSIRQFLEKKI